MPQVQESIEVEHEAYSRKVAEMGQQGFIDYVAGLWVLAVDLFNAVEDNIEDCPDAVRDASATFAVSVLNV